MTPHTLWIDINPGNALLRDLYPVKFKKKGKKGMDRLKTTYSYATILMQILVEQIKR